MDTFTGFPPGPLHTTPIPDLFFSQILPTISDEAELRVTLHVFWLCQQRKERLRAVSRDEVGDSTLRRSLSYEDDWQAALERGLVAAVARGTLLEFRSGTAIYYAPNTAGNRALVAALSKEKPLPKRTPRPLPPAPASPSPATILYERYIGLITPMIAHELEEAERIYPAEWLAEAFALAAERAKPHWRYVDGILRGWASDGKR